MVELLSPAGNFISLRAVLENGADVNYLPDKNEQKKPLLPSLTR